MSARPTRTARHRPTPSTLLRALTVMGLLGDAIVHHHLAAGYQEASPGGVGLGTLFRLEAVFALAAGVFVLVRGTRRAYSLALVVALSALLAVLASRYVDLPAFGPVPAVYEPVWFPEKTISAIAEALAAAAALMALTPSTAGRHSKENTSGQA